MDDRPNVDYLRGRKVCATGRLVSMTHAELAKLVSACGGTYVRSPGRTSLILVVGDRGWLADRAASGGGVFDRARRLRAYGYAIEFTPENEFLERLGLNQSAAAIRGRHTFSDLSRILDVSTVRLRRWVQAGLIQPVATQYQISYFDFHQVAFIRQLYELVEAGASLTSIKRSLERAKDWSPYGQSVSSLCANMERDGRVLVRLRDQLIDQTGQRYFDFAESGHETSTVFAGSLQSGIHDLCDEALGWEEIGQWDEAAAAYQRALQLNPDHPTLHFDLGNVLYQLGRADESIAAFRRAIALDPAFAMAWHNLGSVYAERREWADAEASLRQALRLVPTYADSHFTLAQVLRRLNRLDEAVQHERAFAEHSRADQVRSSRENMLRVVCADSL